MDQYEIEINMKKAEAFIAEARKWGKKVYQPFQAQVLLEIFEAYEARIKMLADQHGSAMEIVGESHQRHIAELTGKIGGLTKQLNQRK